MEYDLDIIKSLLNDHKYKKELIQLKTGHNNIFISCVDIKINSILYDFFGNRKLILEFRPITIDINPSYLLSSIKEDFNSFNPLFRISDIFEYPIPLNIHHNRFCNGPLMSKSIIGIPYMEYKQKLREKRLKKILENGKI